MGRLGRRIERGRWRGLGNAVLVLFADVGISETGSRCMLAFALSRGWRETGGEFVKSFLGRLTGWLGVALMNLMLRRWMFDSGRGYASEWSDRGGSWCSWCD